MNRDLRIPPEVYARRHTSTPPSLAELLARRPELADMTPAVFVAAWLTLAAVEAA